MSAWVYGSHLPEQAPRALADSRDLDLDFVYSCIVVDAQITADERLALLKYPPTVNQIPLTRLGELYTEWAST